MARVTVSFDCEGPCCCRCDCCKGVGFWSAYSLTIPAANSHVDVYYDGLGGSGIWLGLNYSRLWILPLNPLFGSAGGNGICTPDKIIFGVDGVAVSLRVVITMNADGSADLLFTVTASYSGTSTSTETQSVYWKCESFNCRTGGTFVYDHYTTTSSGPVSPLIIPDADYSGTTIVVTPDGSATWNQCGQNADGTDVEIAPPPMLANFMSAKTSLDVIERKERCDFYEGRDEDRPGCNGWLCAGKCSKGISQCMPGIFCQTCEDYEVDPDYEELGLDGWFR